MTGLKIGTADAADVRYGSAQVNEVRHGSELIWQKIGLTLVATVTAGLSSTIVAPGNIDPGDIMVLHDVAYNNGTTPTSVTPSGFTTGHTFSGNDGSGRRFKSMISHKIAVGTEDGATLTGMNDTSEVKCLRVYRPVGFSISTVTYAPTWGETTSVNDPADVSSVDAAAQTSPIIMLGAALALDVDPVFTLESPAFDVTNLVGAGAVIHGNFGSKIYASSPQDHTIGMTDQGTYNGLIIGWLKVA